MSDEGTQESQKKNSFSDWWVRKTQAVILPGLEGLSLYDLMIIFYAGIMEGAFSARASAISFSFFMAVFPFLLFIELFLYFL